MPTTFPPDAHAPESIGLQPDTSGPEPDPLKVAVFPARAFLGLGWIRAGVEKLIDVDWWTGEALRTFLTTQAPHQLSFMDAPSEWIFAPLAVPVALFVMVAQLMIGFCFLTGRKLHKALWGGIALNCIFVLMGAVTPSAFYLVIQVTLLAALSAAVVIPATIRLGRIALAGVVAASLAPSISTLHPAEVIDDPALMLITVALLAATVDALRIPWSSLSLRRLFTSP